MATAARKARKRAGIQFTKEQKTPTPILERSWFAGLVPGPAGTPKERRLQPRSRRSVERALEARGWSEKQINAALDDQGGFVKRLRGLTRRKAA